MKTVTLRALRRDSAVLDSAAGGEEILVTRFGKPYVRIIPVKQPLLPWGRKTSGPDTGCLLRSDSAVRVEGAGVRYLLDTAPWVNAVMLAQLLPPRIRRAPGS